MVTTDPRLLLMTAHRVLKSEASVFDGFRVVTAAGLTRQAIEAVVDQRLAELGVGGRLSRKAGFLCLAAATSAGGEDDDGSVDAVRTIHHIWGQLSDVCHASSYDLPPSYSMIEAWITTIARFIESGERGNLGRG